MIFEIKIGNFMIESIYKTVDMAVPQLCLKRALESFVFFFLR